MSQSSRANTQTNAQGRDVPRRRARRTTRRDRQPAVQVERRRHERIRPLHACARLHGDERVSHHVHDLSMGGMSLARATEVSVGDHVVSRLLLQSQAPMTITSTVVRVDDRGVALQFIRMTHSQEERLRTLLRGEAERTRTPHALVVHRSAHESRFLRSLIERLGVRTTSVQTPLDLVACIEARGLPVTTLLLDEGLWGDELGACSRALAERYPQLELLLLKRSVAGMASPHDLFTHVIRPSLPARTLTGHGQETAENWNIER